jgi:hypothetical protein
MSLGTSPAWARLDAETNICQLPRRCFQAVCSDCHFVWSRKQLNWTGFAAHTCRSILMAQTKMYSGNITLNFRELTGDEAETPIHCCVSPFRLNCRLIVDQASVAPSNSSRRRLANDRQVRMRNPMGSSCDDDLSFPRS